MSGYVKEIGHRQVYDILQSRKPRAADAGLWGFWFLPWFEAWATAARAGICGLEGGRLALGLAWILASTKA
jgi:hypothetical protein